MTNLAVVFVECKEGRANKCFTSTRMQCRGKRFFYGTLELAAEASDGDGGVPEACGADDGIDAPAECEQQQHQRHTNVIHAHCVAGGDVGL